MPCRFVTLGNNVSYTTANEIGNFLIRKGVKFKQFSNDSMSYHFGTVFNERLITGLSKFVRVGNFSGYDYEDFPKLVQSLGSNDVILQSLVSWKMCEPSSIAPISKGSTDRALDLYTYTAFQQLCESYGVPITVSDYCIQDFLSIPPMLSITQRINKKEPVRGKSLFATEV